MQRKKVLAALGLMCSLAMLSGPALAEVYQTTDKTHELEAAPKDLATSTDGKHTFVLLEGGKVMIYSESGQTDEIKVDPSMDRIVADGSGEKIIVSSTAAKKVEEIYVDFVQNIEIEGSPFLGSPSAPIVLAVFSDFE